MKTYKHSNAISQNEISEIEGDKILGKTESELNDELSRYYRRLYLQSLQEKQKKSTVAFSFPFRI